jgi:hypothetical protein
MKAKINYFTLAVIVILTTLTIWGLTIQKSYAHCDTLDGPVVTAARAALDKGDVTTILKWIPQKNEKEIRLAFERTISVRKLSPQAKELADMYFFETLVRIHRAGEGEPYTGLQPEGTVTEPAIIAADKAIETGSDKELIENITQLLTDGINKRFEHTIQTQKDMNKSIEAGREYVEAYVEFVHYVENLHSLASGRIHIAESIHKTDSDISGPH